LSIVGFPTELRGPLDYANNIGLAFLDGFSSVQLWFSLVSAFFPSLDMCSLV